MRITALKYGTVKNKDCPVLWVGGMFLKDLLAEIFEICAEDPNYGPYQICLELKFFHGYNGSYYLILKLCKVNNLNSKKNIIPKGLPRLIQRYKPVNITELYIWVIFLNYSPSPAHRLS